MQGVENYSEEAWCDRQQTSVRPSAWLDAGGSDDEVVSFSPLPVHAAVSADVALSPPSGGGYHQAAHRPVSQASPDSVRSRTPSQGVSGDSPGVVVEAFVEKCVAARLAEVEGAISRAFDASDGMENRLRFVEKSMLKSEREFTHVVFSLQDRLEQS